MDEGDRQVIQQHRFLLTSIRADNIFQDKFRTRMEPETKKQKLDSAYVSEGHNLETSEKNDMLTSKEALNAQAINSDDHVTKEIDTSAVIGSCGDHMTDKTDKDTSTSAGPDDTGNMKFVKEEDVGILCYISDLPGCHGVIKQRYSDFIVNEIDENGKIVELTKLEVDPTPEEVTKDTKDVFSLPESTLTLLTELSSAMAESQTTSKEASTSVNIELEDDKELRTKYHKAIKSKFPGLETATETVDGAKVIKVFKKSNMKTKNRWKNDWPSGRGNYCRFVLYKENRDTMAAIGDLARFLSVNKNMFQYAGTKDRRAKTTQEITVYRMFAERLEELNSRMKYIHFGNYRYVNEPLKLGKCKGNKFTIVLRNVTGEDDLLDKAMGSLKENGFINYFGMQRFGTTSIPTHHIGRAILKNDFEEAVNLILVPRPGETGKIVECRQCWEQSKDAGKALSKLPNQHSVEKTILQELKSNSKNHCNAFQKIARNTKLMYLHAYQSYVWNMIVSKRIKQYGLSPIVGDLVLPANIDDVDDNEETENKDLNKIVPTIVEESNLSQYSIQDVVLPLPGHDIIYPSNEVAQWYESILSEDDLQMESLKHKIKSLALPGAYRRMVIQPGAVAWKLCKYSDVNVELTLSDLDRLQNKPEPKSEIDGQYKALKVEMTLPTSCYATMALREVLKIDTSAYHQSTLNVT